MDLVKKLVGVAALSLVSTLVVAEEAKPEEVKPAVAQYLEIGPNVSFNGNSIGTYYYYNLSFKVPGEYSFTPELYNTVSFKDGGVSALTSKHGFFRVNLSKAKLAKVGAFDLAMNYRYTPPTTMGAQKAGTFGSIGVRPALSAKFGEFSVTLRDQVTTHLIRNRYQVNVGGNTPAGNSLISNVFEFIGTQPIVGDLGLGMYFLNGNTMVGAAPGSTETTWSNSMEWEVSLTHPLGFVDAELAYGHATDYGVTGADMSFASGDDSLTLKLSKSF